MLNATPSRTSARALRTLNHRLDTQRDELGTCTTAAMVRCLKQALADTRRQMRQMRELLTA